MTPNATAGRPPAVARKRFHLRDSRGIKRATAHLRRSASHLQPDTTQAARPIATAGRLFYKGFSRRSTGSAETSRIHDWDKHNTNLVSRWKRPMQTSAQPLFTTLCSYHAATCAATCSRLGVGVGTHGSSEASGILWPPNHRLCLWGGQFSPAVYLSGVTRGGNVLVGLRMSNRPGYSQEHEQRPILYPPRG